MRAKLHHEQIIVLSKYFTDLSKILIGSAVIGFFIPNTSAQVTLPAFIGGFLFSILFLLASIQLVKQTIK